MTTDAQPPTMPQACEHCRHWLYAFDELGQCAMRGDAMTASDDRCEAWQARLLNPCATAHARMDDVAGDSVTFRGLVSANLKPDGKAGGIAGSPAGIFKGIFFLSGLESMSEQFFKSLRLIRNNYFTVIKIYENKTVHQK